MSFPLPIWRTGKCTGQHWKEMTFLGSTIQMRPSTPDEWSNPTPFIWKMLESIDHVAEKEKFETAPEQ